MSETSGVTESTSRRAPAATGGSRGLLKNKPLLFGGGALALFLLFSHRGASVAANSPNAQLTPQVAPYDPSLYGGSGYGGFTPSNGSGGSGTYDPNAIAAGTSPGIGSVSGGGATDGSGGGGSSGSAPFVATSGGGGGPPADTSGGGPSADTSGGGGTYDTTTIYNTGAGAGAGSIGTNVGTYAPPRAGTPAPVARTPARPVSHPKEPARGRPAPANERGQHPATRHKTSSGTRRKSPALVESMSGAGSGVMIMGREFPGAVSHYLGAPCRCPDGTIGRTVTVNYGGRSEVHTVWNNGARWTDRQAGLNPPSRGIPVNTNPIPA